MSFNKYRRSSSFLKASRAKPPGLLDHSPTVAGKMLRHVISARDLNARSKISCSLCKSPNQTMGLTIGLLSGRLTPWTGKFPRSARPMRAPRLDQSPIGSVGFPVPDSLGKEREPVWLACWVGALGISSPVSLFIPSLFLQD